MRLRSKPLITGVYAAMSLCYLGVGRANTIDLTDDVGMLETWLNGNLAFALSPAASTCNAQFILNVSSAGTKNRYAALLAAKSKGVRVRVYGTDSCVASDGGGGTYNQASYIHLLND